MTESLKFDYDIVNNTGVKHDKETLIEQIKEKN